MVENIKSKFQCPMYWGMISVSDNTCDIITFEWGRLPFMIDLWPKFVLLFQSHKACMLAVIGYDDRSATRQI